MIKTFYVPSHGQRQRSMHSNGWSSVLIEVGIKGADQICVPLHLRTDFPRVTAKSYSICSRLESRSTSLIVGNDAVQSVATDLYFNHVFLFCFVFQCATACYYGGNLVERCSKLLAFELFVLFFLRISQALIQTLQEWIQICPSIKLSSVIPMRVSLMQDRTSKGDSSRGDWRFRTI